MSPGPEGREPASAGATREDLMREAMSLARAARGHSTPNPPVGAVIVDRAGVIVGRGRTQPPGGSHAEAAALAQAGAAARGGTAVVTLEPCDHHGRTGPCTRALLDAGVDEVVFAVADPNPLAAGGARTLRTAGVRVTGGVLHDEVADDALAAWLWRQRTGRPRVTAKLASTLDGRVAAPDGSSRWITGPAARDHVHAERAALDAIVVGTGTVLIDDPELTARHPDGSPRQRQPRRIVLGHRDLPADARIRPAHPDTIHVRSHDAQMAVAAAGDALDVLVEGGPAVLGAFFAAGLVDRVHAYVAPAVLGAGAAAVRDDTVTTLAQAHRFTRPRVQLLGDDVLLTLATSP